MTVGLYLLRAKQLGLSVSELDTLDVGDVFDMITEKSNDEFKYPYKATQADFDKIFGG